MEQSENWKSLGRLLQWSIWLLHCIELVLRHVFQNIDGTSISPDSFSGPIGKKLSGKVFDWGVGKFKQIKNPSFPVVTNEVLDNLSTDQFYAYRICCCVSSGAVDQDIEHLEVGPLYHAQWLTLACQILRLYVSETKPTKNLTTLAAFCINVYFPSWFQIKVQDSISEGAKNYFAVLDRVRKCTDGTARVNALKSLE